LIQHLIYNLKKNDRGRVKIYGHAVVPLLAPCRPRTFEYLKRKLIDTSYEVGEIDTIIGELQSSYYCLGLKCRDVGNLQELTAPLCVDRKEFSPLARYKPTTDVREYSDIHFDIRFIDIMMQQGVKEAAMNVYKFGKHSIVTERNERRYLPLRELAVTKGLKIVPSFNKFQNYYNREKLDAVDDLVRLNLNSHVTQGSLDQERTLVVSAMKYEIMHFAALQKLYDAADGCNSLDDNRYFRAKREWDTAAAMVIGQTQHDVDYENYGDLLYELSAMQCKTFNACDPKTGEAKINQRIEESFYAGSYLLKRKSCKSVKMYADAIEKLLMVSLIQATLSHAIQNSELPKGTDDPSLAQGFIISRSILPYIDAVDTDAATIIKDNLDFHFGQKPIDYDPDAVFSAFTVAISKMDLDCRDVGYLDSGRSVCGSGESRSSGTRTTVKSMLAFTILSSVAIYIIF
jgi:hypothetical protein